MQALGLKFVCVCVCAHTHMLTRFHPVQNGVLKALSFLFEYIGEMGKDYVYAVTPLLEDALMDRDLVHRQTSASVVKHLTLGVYGLGCEDALQHLFNFVWPNIFEQSPHVINAVMECIEAMRISLGATRVLQHTMQGLWHPARKVREVYWKIYNNLYIGSQVERGRAIARERERERDGSDRQGVRVQKKASSESVCKKNRESVCQ